MLVYVRPSNEALLRARVPGAQEQHGCPLPILFTVRVLRARRAPDRSLPILLRPRVARAQEINRPPPFFQSLFHLFRGSLVNDLPPILDSSDVCRNMNRRVHIEIRKIGKDHMMLPTVATEPKTIEPIQLADDQNTNAVGHNSLADNLLPSLPDPSATDPFPLTTDPASGS